MQIISERFSKHSEFFRLCAILFVFVTAVGLILGLQNYFFIVAKTYTFGNQIVFNLVYWWMWLLFFPIVAIISDKLKNSRAVTYWLVYSLSIIVIIVLHQFLGSLIRYIQDVGRDFEFIFLLRTIRNPRLSLDMAIFIGLVVALDLERYQQENKTQENKFNQLQKTLLESQLNALKSQLQPHFLFNTLNSITTLILERDKDEAERMLVLLREYLQRTIAESSKNEHTLADEMNFIRDYIEIEKVRFGEKLRYVESIQPETEHVLVPVFLLQPLIENAVYHSIAKRTSGGLITVSAIKEGSIARLVVEDDGPGILPTSKKGGGIGLQNTKNRLVQLYGNEHSFKMLGSDTGGARIEICIPLLRKQAGEQR